MDYGIMHILGAGNKEGAFMDHGIMHVLGAGNKEGA